MGSRAELSTYTETSVISSIHVPCSDITADTRSEELSEGQICPKKVKGNALTAGRQDSTEVNCTYTTTGTYTVILHISHCHLRSSHLSCDFSCLTFQRN